MTWGPWVTPDESSIEFNADLGTSSGDYLYTARSGASFNSYQVSGSSPDPIFDVNASLCSWQKARYSYENFSQLWTGTCLSFPASSVGAGSGGLWGTSQTAVWVAYRGLPSAGVPFMEWSFVAGGFGFDLSWVIDNLVLVADWPAPTLPDGAIAYEEESATPTYVGTDVMFESYTEGSAPMTATEIQWFWQIPIHESASAGKYGPSWSSDTIFGETTSRSRWRHGVDPNAIGDNRDNWLLTHQSDTSSSWVEIPDAAVTAGLSAQAALLAGPLADIEDPTHVPSLHVVGIPTQLFDASSFPGTFGDQSVNYGGRFQFDVRVRYTGPRVRFLYGEPLTLDGERGRTYFIGSSRTGGL